MECFPWALPWSASKEPEVVVELVEDLAGPELLWWCLELPEDPEVWLPPDLSRLSWETLSPSEEGLVPSFLSAFFPIRERRSPPSGSLLWLVAEAGVLVSLYLMSLAG